MLKSRWTWGVLGCMGTLLCTVVFISALRRATVHSWQPDGFVTAMVVSQDGQTIVVAEEVNQGTRATSIIRRRVLANGQVVQSFGRTSTPVFSLAQSADERVLVAGGRGLASLWRMRDGILLHTIAIPSKLTQPPDVTQVVFDPDGKTFLMATDDGAVRRWRSTDGTLVTTVLEPRQAPHSGSVAISSTGQHLAVVEEHWVAVWQLDSPGDRLILPVRTVGRLASGHVGLVFSPDETRLAIVGVAHITVWQLTDGAQIAAFREHRDILGSVAWSGDGRMMTSGSGVPRNFSHVGDRTIRVWDAQTGARIDEWDGPAGQTLTIAFGRNGQEVVVSSASAGRPINVWHIKKDR